MLNSWTTFWFVLSAVFLFSGLIWSLSKYAAKVGIVCIPISMALLSAFIFPEEGLDLQYTFGLVCAGVLTVVGISGTLSCALLAEIHNMNKELKELEE